MNTQSEPKSFLDQGDWYQDTRNWQDDDWDKDRPFDDDDFDDGLDSLD